jgi:23S rRNA (adenine2503-C2)-methyltransferase
MTIIIKDLSVEEVYNYINKLGESKYRADQLLNWIYKKNACTFQEMTNLSKDFRIKLSEKVQLDLFKNFEPIKSPDGVIKYRIELLDNEFIESVLIPEEKNSTLCLSTQVGCRFGCKICRTGQMGFKRNLSSGEIIEQILIARKDQKELPKITNLVFMGMGEPLDNFDNFNKALSLIINKDGLDFSTRYITVSTVGYLPKLLILGDSFPGIGLAVSLNSVNNTTRDEIIPFNKKYPIEQIISTLKKYPLKPRRVITIEYVLIKDFNDSIEDARKLVKLLRGIRCKINLIPYNEFEKSPYKSPLQDRIESFRMCLINAGYTCITRKSRGCGINAACGCLATR